MFYILDPPDLYMLLGISILLHTNAMGDSY